MSISNLSHCDGISKFKQTLQETSGKWKLVTSEISYYRKNGEGITKILQNRAFHGTIIICIIVDAAILASKFAGMPDYYANFIWFSQVYI